MTGEPPIDRAADPAADAIPTTFFTNIRLLLKLIWEAVDQDRKMTYVITRRIA